MNLRPPGYEPDELPDCSTPRQYKKWAEKDSNLRSYRNRFTVCPLWPLGNPPMVMESFFDYEIPSHNALGIVQGIIFSPADKQEKSR